MLTEAYFNDQRILLFAFSRQLIVITRFGSNF